MEVDGSSDSAASDATAAETAELWNTLEHNGPLFPAPHERLPFGIGLEYDDQLMELSDLAEEMAVAYARLLGKEFASDADFVENFFYDWRNAMTKEEREMIVDFEKCDFQKINKHILNQTAASSVSSEIEEAHKFCTLDGERVEISNWKMEPPGLFKGASGNKKNGQWKRRIAPEDVTINCSKGREPSAPAGHQWETTVEVRSEQWLAKWRDPIYPNRWKYMKLSSSAALKGVIDCAKFDTPVRLGNVIDEIRKQYRENCSSDNPIVQQLGMALYLIDTFAFRAGGDHTDPDDPDTVGCCSLRKEHITLHEQLSGEPNVIEFDFHGKATVPYHRSQQIQHGVFQILQSMIESKNGSEPIFDRLSPEQVNKFLQEFDADFTTKVFRTFRASALLEAELQTTQQSMSDQEKLKVFNEAMLKVANLCNHKKAPKQLDEEIVRIELEINRCEKELHKTRNDFCIKLRKNTRRHLKEKKEALVKAKESKLSLPNTSKEHYIDPRIIVAWCLKYGIAIEKVYSKKLRKKFQWAIVLGKKDYVFDEKNISHDANQGGAEPGPSTPKRQIQSSIEQHFNKIAM